MRSLVMLRQLSELFSAMAPAGGLVGGAVGDVVGSATAMYGAGGIMAAIGLYFLLYPQLRSLPAATEADEAALDSVQRPMILPKTLGVLAGTIVDERARPMAELVER
jgi:hypothetical protein